jgi:hypothetical protein
LLKPVPVDPQIPLALFHEPLLLFFQILSFLLLFFFLGRNVKDVIPWLVFHGLPDKEDVAKEKERQERYDSKSCKEMFHRLIIKEKA